MKGKIINENSEDGRVNFYACTREENNNQCDCCMQVGKVVEVYIPYTQYTRESDYKKIETKCKPIWMCDECRKGLMRLLNRIEEKEKVEA